LYTVHGVHSYLLDRSCHLAQGRACLWNHILGPQTLATPGRVGHREPAFCAEVFPRKVRDIPSWSIQDHVVA
jgi:hypothetical protein